MLHFAWEVEEEDGSGYTSTGSDKYASLADCQKDLGDRFPNLPITIFRAVCKTATTWENLN